jgi:Secretion system C-terminal sorting domain
MYLQKLKSALVILCLMTTAVLSKAQQGTLELTSFSSSNLSLQGPTAAAQTVTFREDIQNLNSGTQFKPYSNPLSAVVSFDNQVYTTSYTNIDRGIVFGGGNTGSVGGGQPQQSAVRLVYNTFSADFAAAAGEPQNGMYVSSPTGTIVPRYNLGGIGQGFDASGLQGGKDIVDPLNPVDDWNYGFALFTNVEPLFDAGLPANNTRHPYGDIVIKFNRPVKNPVLHFGGMGGSYNYLPRATAGNPNPARQICYFTTEFDVANAGVTTTFMAGNEFFDVTASNQILNSSATPNAGSIPNGSTTNGFLNYGAASGSVRINGIVTEVRLKVFVRGTGQFNFSKNQADIDGADRDPLNGDFFRMSISLDKPTQQISGNVFNDRDGLVDNNVNQSVGVANPATNAGGLLYANLIRNGVVVDTVKVTPEGTFLFDNVATTTVGSEYTVQLSTNKGTIGATPPATALPSGWVNTGENGATSPGNGVGNDGTVNGISAPITVNASDIKPEVNFGIERLPESVDFTRVIPSPSVGTVMTLSPTAAFPLPPLTGSDPEDQPTSGTLSGKTVVLTNLPNNATLKYNGVNVVSGVNIPNFNPNLLTITFNGPAQASSQFNYAYVDASGRPDPTPALYRLVWSGGPLAITLTDFTAVKNNCIAGLTWKTAAEINASRFEIEVSNSNNGVYSKIGSVNATAANGKTYQYNYPMQAGNQYYFRLKMIDKDGAFKYSDVRTLSCDGKGTIITIAPNPVIDQFVISGMESGKNTIVVFAANGQQVKTQIIPQAQGYVNIVNLASGMYSVKVISEKGNVTVGKIIKN